MNQRINYARLFIAFFAIFALSMTIMSMPAYGVLYKITFDHTGLDSSATGTIVTLSVAPNTLTYAQLPYAPGVNWCPGGTTYSYTATVPDGSTKRFVLTGVTGPASPINAHGTVVGAYKTQYKVTFKQTGLDGTSVGTVLTVGAITKTEADLPYTDWFDSGTTYSYTATVNDGSGKQFVLTGVSGIASPIAKGGTVTGKYKTQYQVTFKQSGLDSSAGTNIVLTVGAITKTRTDLPYTDWFDAGTSYNYTDPVPDGSGKQFRLDTATSDFDPASPIYAAGTVTGKYVVQYYLTLVTNPSGVNTPIGEGWYDKNTLASISTDEYVTESSTSRYHFTGWSTTDMLEIDDPSATSTTVKVDKAKTVTANYVIQYKLTLVTNPSGVTTPSGAGWYDTGTSVGISTVMYVDIAPGLSQYRFNGWSTADMSEIADASATSTTVLMDKGKTVTANYWIQYYLTVGTFPGRLEPAPTTPSGWYDECTYVTLKASIEAESPYRGWLLDWWLVDDWAPRSLPVIGTNPPLPNGAMVHMDAPKFALAVYHRAVPDPIGDVNIDGVTDIQDIALIAKAYGSVKGQPGYSWYCDVYEDGRIDLIDLAAAARHVNP